MPYNYVFVFVIDYLVNITIYINVNIILKFDAVHLILVHRLTVDLYYSHLQLRFMHQSHMRHLHYVTHLYPSVNALDLVYRARI